MLTLPVFFAVFILLVFVHEAGHFFVAKAAKVKVHEFGFGYPPRLIGVKRGETEYSINAVPLGGFVRLAGEEDPREQGSLAGKSAPIRFAVLIAGSAMHVLLAIIIFTTLFMVPTSVVTGGEQVQIKQVITGSPAEAAGIQAGDIVVRADGQPVIGFEDLKNAVDAHQGTEITLDLLREGAEVQVQVTPRLDPPPGQGAMGISYGWAVLHTETQSYPFWQAVPKAVSYTFTIPVLLKDGIVQMIEQRDLSGLGGPVGIAQATGEVANMGVAPLFNWIGVLAMMLAVMNLLPIPALDGGRLLLLAIEVVRRGKRIAPEKEKLVHLIGFALLLMLVLVATYNDILRIIEGRSIFQ